jgi:uncharacterized OsmC-like protein
MTSPSPQAVSVATEAHARNDGRLRNVATVRMISPFKDEWKVVSDEPKSAGGDASAPPPLGLYLGALTSCVMTQIRMFAKRTRLSLGAFEVSARVDWQANMIGGGLYEAEGKSIAMDIILNSDASVDDQIDLVRKATKACFVESLLNPAIQVVHRLKTPDGWVEV